MPEINVTLPYRLTGSSVGHVVSKFEKDCQGIVPRRVNIDFRNLGFIEPAGVTFLSNFVWWAHHRGIEAFFRNHAPDREAIRFLDDSLFFEQHLNKKLNQYAAPRITTKPLQRVGVASSHDWIRVNLVPWLASRTGLSEASFYMIQVCVSELFNNILDHSTKNNGSIFMQHFPRLDKISISVADFGVGIPDSVRKIQPEISSNDAILRAVEEGFTSQTTPRNRGVGLHYLLKTVVEGNGGTVSIYSFDGSVCFSPSRVVPGFTVGGFCPGTTIDISLRTDTIVSIEDKPEDLEW
ncbi:ATP-binding protein [Enterovirga sp.]|uniref:ATP-binding protein n=1 Tax=Enterovirga sp. TaxID=2026350 RepID=UPI002BCDA752|nr:ATP-binding protein [Enterovirga sp.]HMO30410.1 ATP-binding protein [Enterovirga sp.]